MAHVLTLIIFQYYNIIEFYKFGGTNAAHNEDSFFVGHLVDDDPTRPIKWTESPRYRLLNGIGLVRGVVQYNGNIITFGGRDSGAHRSDDIAILNIDAKEHWKLSSIKCPHSGYFAAVLDHQQRVHLFSVSFGPGRVQNTHHSIPIQVILANLK